MQYPPERGGGHDIPRIPLPSSNIGGPASLQGPVGTSYVPPISVPPHVRMGWYVTTTDGFGNSSRNGPFMQYLDAMTNACQFLASGPIGGRMTVQLIEAMP